MIVPTQELPEHLGGTPSPSNILMAAAVMKQNQPDPPMKAPKRARTIRR